MSRPSKTEKPLAPPGSTALRLLQPPWRTVLAGVLVVVGIGLAMVLWQPGLEVRDGRHDRGRNGVWLAHGWMGADEWFLQNSKIRRSKT